MPPRSNDFQRLIYRIQRTLAAPSTVTESGMLLDRIINAKREVDVVIETQVSTSRLTISIECVATGRKASVEWVERMIEKHRSLPTNQLMLVSRAGFTKSATQKASAAGVVTYSLAAAIEADWTQIVGKLNRIWFSRFDFVTTAFEVQLVDTGPQWHKIGTAQQIGRADGSGSVSAGEMASTFFHRPEVATAIMQNVPTDGEISASYVGDPIGDCWIKDEQGRVHQIASFRLSFQIKRNTAPIDLSHVAFDKVPVAFGTGDTAFGTTELTIVEPAEFVLGGFATLADPTTGEMKDFPLKAPSTIEGGPTVRRHPATPAPE